MIKYTVTSFNNYCDYIEDIIGYEINLFRGQSSNSPLLPSVARKKPDFNSSKLEIEMLEEFKRQSSLLIKQPTITTDWEWLVLAQHYGLKTRLLDWTSNPLVGLWFACRNNGTLKTSSYVYIFSADNDMLITTNDFPFKTSKTRILKPALNSERIVAQSGWFTAHKYSNSSKRFVSLETNRETKEKITEIEIPNKLRNQFLEKLSIFGVNYRTMFPDLVGLCDHLNWEYRNKL